MKRQPALHVSQQTWKHEFFVRPNTYQGNEEITNILSTFGQVESFERSMHLPDFDLKQRVYAVTSRIMRDIEQNVEPRHYVAFVRYRPGGALHRYRSQAERKEESRKRSLRAIRRRVVKQSIAR